MLPGRRRPLIGIAAASYVVSRPFGDLDVDGIPRTYVDQVAAAGGCPVLVPPGTGTDVLDALDGLVLAGGGDLDPALYGREYGAGDGAADGVDRRRDEAEVRITRAARERGCPVLGVCRGAQVVVVADGGTLVPDLGADRPHVLVGTTHAIATVAGSAVAAVLGRRREVSSLHHQAIDCLAAGWRVTARADDGVVEAVEWDGPGCWSAVGVQWHPELDDTGPRLFSWLVQEAGLLAG